MKELAFFTTLCITIFSVAPAFANRKSNESTQVRCNIQDDLCFVDADCCSKFCTFRFFQLVRICSDKFDFFDWMRYYYPFTDQQKALCGYEKPPNHSKNDNDKLFNLYGLSATHPTLPAGTKVIVTIGKKTVPLTINHINKHKEQRVNLVLSDDAAKVFGIKNNGIVDCSMYVPLMENNLILKTVRYMLPYIGVLILLTHTFGQ